MMVWPRWARLHRGAPLFLLFGVISTVPRGVASAPQPLDPALIGQWSPTVTLPIIPIHSALLQSGQILIYDSDTSSASPPRLFYPATLTTLPVPYADSPNLFCSDIAPLSDGRMFVVGGHVGAYIGINGATVFNPSTNTWTDTTPMNYARWYPSLIRLSDGRMLVVSGATNCGGCVSPTAAHDGIALFPELFNPATAQWSPIATASLSLPLYPHLYLLPDGRVFAAASQEDPIVSQVLNLSTGTWSAVDATHTWNGGSSVMYRPWKIMKSGSGINPDYATANSAATTYVIDMSQGSPAWRQTASMAYARTQHNLVMLPDGTVLASGGSANSNVNDLASASLTPEIWNPNTETWSSLAAGQIPRLYHSVALLLPDGRVFAGGGGHPSGFGITQYDAEIYSPPYLFKGARPTIVSAPSVIGYGQSMFLETPDGAAAVSVALIGQGSVTHGFNSNQRYVPLAFTQTAGGLNVTAPVDGNLAPPGFYMMFLVNGNGVPSMASWIRLPAPGDDAQAPTVPPNLAATSVTGRVDLTWGAASDNIGVVGYDVFRSTTPGFLADPGNRIAQTTTPGYSDQGLNSGTYYYLVRARDAAGNVSLSSNQVSATLAGDSTPPGTTPGIVVSFVGPGKISLAWAAAIDDIGVSDYRVERCLGSGCSSFVELGTSSGTTYDNPGLTAGTTYQYRVRAEDARGNLGGYSSVVSATTSAVSSGLVGAWGFNEDAGATASDVSGFANNGLLGATTWTTQGKYGAGLAFDGTSSQIAVPGSASLDLTSAMTLEAWVNPSTAATDWRSILAKNTDRYYLMASSDPQGMPAVGGTFGSGNLNVFGPQLLPLNAWRHVAATFDGASLRLYVNGASVASTAQSGALTTSTENLLIGADHYGEYFQGVLDEIRIYNRALSVSEIQADMNNPVEIGPLRFSVTRNLQSGSVVLSWTSAALNGSYRVRRAIGPSPATFATASCFVVSGTTFTDPAPANDGNGYDYLVDPGSSCP